MSFLRMERRKYSDIYLSLHFLNQLIIVLLTIQ
jgi:hypothetical protein